MGNTLDIFPSFRRPTPSHVEYLFEDDDLDIYRDGESVVMRLSGTWKRLHIRLAQRFRITDLVVSNGSVPDLSIDFIRELPPISVLSIGTYENIDLSLLQSRQALKYLRIHWRSQEQPAPVDLSLMSSLVECHINLVPALASVCRCGSLQILEVFESPRVRHLDLHELSYLRELIVNGCPALSSVQLNPSRSLSALKVSNCPGLGINLLEMCPNVEHFALSGRFGFNLEDITSARHLKTLILAQINPLPPLGFLRELPKLNVVEWLPVSPTDRLSRGNAKVIEEINQRGRTGRGDITESGTTSAQGIYITDAFRGLGGGMCQTTPL